MTIREIIDAAIDKKIDYPKAKEALTKLKLPASDFEEYDRILVKLLGKDSVFREPVYQLPSIPNEMYSVILQDAIKQVRQEKYSPEIAQHLYDNYMLGPSLINYFLNESISSVRMNSLTPEEIVQIGESYLRALKFTRLATGALPTLPPVKRRKHKKEVKEQINAEQVNEVVVTEYADDEIFEDNI